MVMSWGTELWDQFESIEIHTQKGLDICFKYTSFMKERACIESEYAAKLKKLVKNFQPKKKEKGDKEENECSNWRAFNSLTKEVKDIAGQHDEISENLGRLVSDETNKVHEVKTKRKKNLQESERHRASLCLQEAQGERSKKQYEKAFKEAEKGQEMYKKADADVNLSRADVEKAKTIRNSRLLHCEACKRDYALELQKTNESRRNFYQVLQPQIFKLLQDLEMERIADLQAFVRSAAEIERSVMPILTACYNGMVKAADDMDAAKDCQLAVDRYKSGFELPGDLPFEDLDQPSPGGTPDSHNQANTVRGGAPDGRGTMGGGGKAKRRAGFLGIFSNSKMDDTREDYSHLPPNQQKKRLNQKIASIRATIAKESSERDGLMKMQGVYKQNPALGDSESLSKEMDENAGKLDRLKTELNKFETYLADMDSDSLSRHDSLPTRVPPAQIGGQVPPPPPAPNSTIPPPPPPLEHNLSQISSADGDDDDSYDDIDDDYVTIGQGSALYQFEAPDQGSIRLNEGEKFSILERDQGDGWTRILKEDGAEGFVPTSYVECQFF